MCLFRSMLIARYTVKIEGEILHENKHNEG